MIKKAKPAKPSAIEQEIVDYLLTKVENPADIFNEGGILKQLKKALTERILDGELTATLGYSKHDNAGDNSGNSRNGYSQKTLKTRDGDMEINIPRDRNNEFEPIFIPKHQTRFDDMDNKIISLYSRGMTTRDIQEQLKDLYGVEVSASLISNVTDEVIDEVKAWQSRPLDKLYPIVYLDALVIKITRING